MGPRGAEDGLPGEVIFKLKVEDDMDERSR